MDGEGGDLHAYFWGNSDGVEHRAAHWVTRCAARGGAFDHRQEWHVWFVLDLGPAWPTFPRRTLLDGDDVQRPLHGLVEVRYVIGLAQHIHRRSQVQASVHRPF